MLTFQKSNWQVHIWLMVTAFSIFILLLSLLAYINTGSLEMMLNIRGIITEGAIILIGISVAVYYVYYVTRYFDRVYSNNLLAIKRYLYELLSVVAGGFLINYTFQHLFIWLVVVPEPDQAALNLKLNNLLMVNQTLMIIMYGVIAGFKTIKNLREKEKEISRIEKELLHAQFETVKNQLNPHFLFNSLSVLTSLVHVDADRAEIFIDKLSKTYRYLLDQREKEIVPLLEEVDFLQNFCFLVQQRYDKKLQISVDDCGDYQKMYLLPQSFLIIIEYIITTNSMSAAHPLKIEISTKNKFVLIRHNLAPNHAINERIVTQMEELKKSYTRMGKALATDTDEFAQASIYKIPLFPIND